MKGSSSAASLSILYLSTCWLCLLDATDFNTTTVLSGEQNVVNKTEVTSQSATDLLYSTVSTERNNITTFTTGTTTASMTSGDHATVGSSATTQAVSNKNGRRTSGKAGTSTLTTMSQPTVQNKEASGTNTETTPVYNFSGRSTTMSQPTVQNKEASGTNTETTPVYNFSGRSTRTIVVLLLFLALFCLFFVIFLAKRQNQERARGWVRRVEARYGFQLCPVQRGSQEQREADISSLAEQGGAPDDDSSDDYSSFGGMNLQEGIKVSEEDGAQDGGNTDDEQEGKNGDSSTGVGQEEARDDEAGYADITIL